LTSWGADGIFALRSKSVPFGSESAMRRFLLVSVTTLFVLVSACMETRSFARQEKGSSLFDRDDITVVITDSGLGGLSITAEAALRLQRHRGFHEVRIIFCNALFSLEGGYNSLRSRTEKIRVFDSALHSIETHYQPDLILIGCNTLSALYPDTSFAQDTETFVRGIIESGVDLIAQKLREFPESRVIILGTQTTVEEGAHRKQLVEKGFLSERIHQQACPDLVPYIERGYGSPETEMLISAYVEEALQKLPVPGTPLLVSLNCTHYGYSQDLWREAFRAQGAEPLAILNPNPHMLDFLFPGKTQNRFSESRISVEVVSLVKIGDRERESLGAWLQRLSPETARALAEYRLDPDLFEWKPYVRRD
jgi:glutamate racemase